MWPTFCLCVFVVGVSFSLCVFASLRYFPFCLCVALRQAGTILLTQRREGRIRNPNCLREPVLLPLEENRCRKSSRKGAKVAKRKPAGLDPSFAFFASWRDKTEFEQVDGRSRRHPERPSLIPQIPTCVPDSISVQRTLTQFTPSDLRSAFPLLTIRHNCGIILPK